MKISVPNKEALEYEGGGTIKDALVALDNTLLKDYVAARYDQDRVAFHTDPPRVARPD